MPSQLAGFSDRCCWGGNRGGRSRNGKAEITSMTETGSTVIGGVDGFRPGAISSSKNQPLLPVA